QDQHLLAGNNRPAPLRQAEGVAAARLDWPPCIAPARRQSHLAAMNQDLSIRQPRRERKSWTERGPVIQADGVQDFHSRVDRAHLHGKWYARKRRLADSPRPRHLP